MKKTTSDPPRLDPTKQMLPVNIKKLQEAQEKLKQSSLQSPPKKPTINMSAVGQSLNQNLLSPFSSKNKKVLYRKSSTQINNGK